jgi:hypothetical protein
MARNQKSEKYLIIPGLKMGAGQLELHLGLHHWPMKQ